jgi:hypothetical protein
LLCLFVLFYCCSIFIHCAAAVPAYHLRRPVKAILDRDEDMQMTGAHLLCSHDRRVYSCKAQSLAHYTAVQQTHCWPHQCPCSRVLLTILLLRESWLHQPVARASARGARCSDCTLHVLRTTVADGECYGEDCTASSNPAVHRCCGLAGTRHPFLATYKVGFTKQGKVTALDVDLYNNAGGGQILLCCKPFSCLAWWQRQAPVAML